MNAIRHAVIAALAVGVVFTRTASAQAPGGDDRVLAEVAGRSIRAADFASLLTAERARAVGERRLDAFTSSAKTQLLDNLVSDARLARAARERKLDERPDVRQRIEMLVDSYLAQVLLADVASGAPTDPTSVRRYYDEHLDAFKAGGRVRARHIIVKTEAEAVAIRGKLLRHADFASLADEHNVDSTRGKGGELGWIKRGVMMPAFEQAVFALRVAEVGPVVQTPYGFHVAQVEEIEPARPRPFEDVRADIERRIAAERVAAFKARLATEQPVKVNAAVLSSIR